MELDALHYFNRGVNKEKIFFEEENYDFLIRTMFRFLPAYNVDLIAYCLMPNHYHLLIAEAEVKEGSKYVQRIFNSYTQAINRRYLRVGTLFQASAKHQLFSSLEDLATVVGYIHLNPVTAGLVAEPSGWKFSEYNEWIEKDKNTRKVVDYRQALFGSVQDYKDYIERFEIDKASKEKELRIVD